MIEFSCHCGFGFSVQDDMAGALVQCPKCRRLNDVPLLSDLEHLEDGGIYKMEAPVVPPTQTVQEIHRVFTREHVDQDGAEIDLRPTMDDVMRAGSQEIPLELHDQVLPGAPKYDPITGELIRPIDVQPGEQRINPAAVPMARQALGYASSESTQVTGFVAVLWRLLRPANIVVMLFILLGHMFLQGMWVTMVMGFVFIFLAPLLLFMAIVAHYGNVIDEIGPGEKDELPTPMRNASLRDDMWVPFTQVAGAAIICFIPALVLEHRFDFLPLTIVALAIGAVFFPALVLTTTTSGSSLNLRPDRVLGVMRRCGARYAIAVLAFVAAIAVYVAGLAIADLAAAKLFSSGNIAAGGSALALGYSVLAGGIYLLHAFCYYMGTLYRAEHMSFPWVLQRHIPTKLMERTRPSGGHLPPPTANSPQVRQRMQSSPPS